MIEQAGRDFVTNKELSIGRAQYILGWLCQTEICAVIKTYTIPFYKSDLFNIFLVRMNILLQLRGAS